MWIIAADSTTSESGEFTTRAWTVGVAFWVILTLMIVAAVVLVVRRRRGR
jgi:hypothetical protein